MKQHTERAEGLRGLIDRTEVEVALAAHWVSQDVMLSLAAIADSLETFLAALEKRIEERSKP